MENNFQKTMLSMTSYFAQSFLSIIKEHWNAVTGFRRKYGSLQTMVQTLRHIKTSQFGKRELKQCRLFRDTESWKAIWFRLYSHIVTMISHSYFGIIDRKSTRLNSSH